MKILIILVLIFLVFTISNAQSDSVSNSGRTAPNFVLENMDRENIEPNDFIGTGPVLLCFWSSCCKSAVTQVEAFAKLYEKYSQNGFVLLALATDNEKTISRVKPYVKIKNFKFPVLYDSNKAIARIYFAYDVPYCVLINNSGNIVYSHLGYMKGDEIEIEKTVFKMLSKN